MQITVFWINGNAERKQIAPRRLYVVPDGVSRSISARSDAQRPRRPAPPDPFGGLQERLHERITIEARQPAPLARSGREYQHQNTATSPLNTQQMSISSYQHQKHQKHSNLPAPSCIPDSGARTIVGSSLRRSGHRGRSCTMAIFTMNWTYLIGIGQGIIHAS